MPENRQKPSPKVATANLLNDDFLSEHLGQLLVRQPMSPKSPVTSHDLPIDYTKGPTSMRRHASQTQMSKSRSRNSGAYSPKRAASSAYANTEGAKTPDLTSPGCDDLFSSFFSTPKAVIERQITETKSTSGPGPASVSMSTTFGKKQLYERRPLSRTNSDKGSTTSLSSLSQQQNLSSRRESETTQPSNGSGEFGQSAPETPPEGVGLASIASCDEAEDATQSKSTFIPASSRASFGFQQYGNLTSPNEEEKWQIFKEGGVIEPPEASEVNTIARKDVQNAKLLPAQRPKASLGLGSSQTSSSRYTSMTSSRFQSYRSTLSSVPTEMDVHDESNEFMMVNSRMAKPTTVSQIEKADPTSIAKQLAARANSVTLVPSGDDGRTFVFVSRDAEIGDPSRLRALRRDGHSV